MCTKSWDTSYDDLQELLNLPSLSNHRIFFKLRSVLIETKSHINRSLQLTQPFVRTNSYYYSFVPNSIFHWNLLPEYKISSL